MLGQGHKKLSELRVLWRKPINDPRECVSRAISKSHDNDCSALKKIKNGVDVT